VSNSPAMYPMLLEPVLQTRVWGGRQLETRLGKKLPGEQPYGESWEIFWKNRVTNGVFAGQTLGEVIEQYPEAMVGGKDVQAEFPLLVKFLDAQDWLSVQVHPTDSLAKELEGEPRGKTECWYIIDAEPGAKLVYGFAEPMDANRFRTAIETGRAKDVMQYVEVAPGDFIFVPAGMMHPIGPGILLYELQQTSDTTNPVYDWDRMGLDGKPRELHIDKSLKCTTYEVNPDAKVKYHFEQHGAWQRARLAANEYFTLDRILLNEQGTLQVAAPVHTITVTKGCIRLASNTGQFEPLEVKSGESVFVPAQAGSYMATATGETELLLAYKGNHTED
jgi:mannose-6-phosphate isomerase